MPKGLFHSAIESWFKSRFGEPTEPQRLGWPSIARRENVLIAAPTGSGKTLAAFLVCIDKLVKDGIQGRLKDESKVLYLSPLKALASDIKKNLQDPLAEIHEALKEEGITIPSIRVQVRTGDTPQHQRAQVLRKPPHILVTTPESFYLMLTSEGGRQALATIETVIVDEIHALARDKRGSHMSLSLERLKGLTRKVPHFIGLSATQKPIDEIARFLVGVGGRCKTIDVGHARDLDLALLVPPSPLTTLAPHEQWDEIYALLAENIRTHRSTLIFVNTRRLAERVAYRLADLLGEEAVLCHHGSLSKERRLNAETLLKEGKLKAIVATASLELGIDIGYIDLVCQLGVPYSIATSLQRIGRSGHAVKATPKGRFIPLSRDELLESLALIRAVREGVLDRIEIPKAPVDVLAQQLIAECAGRGENGMLVSEAYRMFTRAWPYRDLTEKDFKELIEMAASGYAEGRRRYAYLMWDRIQDRISVKAGARLAALTSGGAIPEMGEYRVVLEEDGTFLGTLNEDFAIESLAGDIFVLGTHSWRIKWVRGGEVVVEDAHGQPPSIPFWLGEAPGRTKEFSKAVSSLRMELGEFVGPSLADDLEQLKEQPRTRLDDAIHFLTRTTGVPDKWPLLQAAFYVASEKSALGLIPTQEKVIFERFFDEVGGMHLVIHSPYGARINRGWGLALRKRFCRQFDFELQASADDDGIVLSLGPQQTFPLESFFTMLNEENIEHFLVQALLDAPMFGVRWRWNATRSLAILRQVGGKRTPPALQRFRSEDLLSNVFPAQTACQDNAVTPDREIPDHPLVRQTVKDCLTEATDLDGLKNFFSRVRQGEVTFLAKDTREPSPFAYQLVNSYPFAFLDDTPAEDRRTRSIAMRPALSMQELQDLERMDPAAIQQVTEEAWPAPRTADELYEVLVASPGFPSHRLKAFAALSAELVDQKRASLARVVLGTRELEFLVAAESVPTMASAYDGIAFVTQIEVPRGVPTLIPRDVASQSILKGWLDISGPVSFAELSALFGLEGTENQLLAIEAKGEILRCKLNPSVADYSHWCSRGLLRRIHRLTVENLRERIRPVNAEDYFEFIFEEQNLNLASEAQRHEPTPDALLEMIEILQGYESPALSWERELLAGRMQHYEPSLLDELTSHALVAFGRLTPKKARMRVLGRSPKVTSVMPLTFALRENWAWIAASEADSVDATALSSDAQSVWEALKTGGAQFIDELSTASGLLHTQVENALGELVSEGLVSSDHFHALRNILAPSKKERVRRIRVIRGIPRRVRRAASAGSLGGRWAVLRRPELSSVNREERFENWAWQLLARYGVVFRDIIEKETLAPSWGELARVFRRLEARGEIRGGRFIHGVNGEQFAVPGTFEKLAKIREERAKGKRSGSYAVISSADPLNLVGVITNDRKIASSARTRILFQEGRVAAVYEGDQIETREALTEDRLRSLRLIGPFRRVPAVSPLREGLASASVLSHPPRML